MAGMNMRYFCFKDEECTETVKKGTALGTYDLKIKVTATGDTDYARCSKTVSVKIRVE